MIQLELDLTWFKKISEFGFRSFSGRTVAEIATLNGISRIAVPLDWDEFLGVGGAFATNLIFVKDDPSDLVNHPGIEGNLTIAEITDGQYSPMSLSRTDDIKFAIDALNSCKVNFWISPQKDQIKTAYDLGASGVVLDAREFLSAHDHHKKMVALEILSNLAMQAYRYDLEVSLGGDFDIPDCRYLRGLEQFDFVTIGKSFFNRSLLLGAERTTQEFLKVL